MARLQRKEIYPLIDIQINGQIAQKRRIRTYIKSCIAYLSPRLRKDIRIELNVLTTLEESAYAHCYGDRNGVQIVWESGREFGGPTPMEGGWRRDSYATLSPQVPVAKCLTVGRKRPASVGRINRQ